MFHYDAFHIVVTNILLAQSIRCCSLGYSDFNNLMGFTSKKLPYIILNNVYQNFFKRISHFLRICIIRFKNILIVYSMTPKFICVIFLLMDIQKNTEFYAGFKSV